MVAGPCAGRVSAGAGEPAGPRAPLAAAPVHVVRVGGVPPGNSLHSGSHFIPLSDGSRERGEFCGITHGSGPKQAG